MSPARKDEKRVTVEAQLEVSWGKTHRQKVRTYDKAWRLSLELAREGNMPVRTTFLGFVRKEG